MGVVDLLEIYGRVVLATGAFWVSLEAWIKFCGWLGFPFARAIRKYGGS
ncbi:hypothetical protein [Natrinema versiforme]|nr:hypothetical protein [Natrinema versiforme]